jgi:hypothetical protein
MNNANRLNMDMKNNNLKQKKKHKDLFTILFDFFLPDACAGIEKLAVDVG